MNEDDWNVAWSFFERGWTFREIERHFGVGHTTIATGFQRRGWYDRSSGAILRQTSKKPSAVKEQGSRRVLNKGWTPTLEFMAGWLDDKGHSPEHIAEVVNLHVDMVRRYLNSTSGRMAA